MELKKAIEERKSVRGFLPDKVSKETIENVECTDLSEDYLMGCEDILNKMQELEGNKDE